MSDKELIGARDASEPAGALPTAEMAAEAKRLAARRRFLTRGAAGTGFVVLTLLHQRGEAWTNTHILSLPYTGTWSNKVMMVPS